MPSPLAPQTAPASPLFLREDEVRQGIELLHFGHAHLFAAIDAPLAQAELGRAHHRALYFVARQPNMPVGTLMRLLGVTKQSLGRVLDDLAARGLIETQPGLRDRRQKLLRLTAEGQAIEARLFEALRERMASAYSQAGQGSVTGFWRVLEGLIAPEERGAVMALQIPRG